MLLLFLTHLLRAKLMVAMATVPLYKTLLDKYLLLAPADWYKLTTDELYRQLQFVTSNSRVVHSQLNMPASHGPRDVAVSNVAVTGKPKPTCFDFKKNGVCNRQSCPFKHKKGDDIKKAA